MYSKNYSKKNAQNFRFEHYGIIYDPIFAEREGFEPPVHCCTMVFKTTAFDHSAISPADGKSKIFLVFTHKLTAKISDYIFVT